MKGEPEDEEPEFVSANDLTSDFCDNTTAHGLNRVNGAKNWWGKLTWGLLFGVFTLTFIYQAGTLLIEYYQWPVTMKIRVVNQQNQLFPAITICNQNRIMKSKLAGTRFEQLPAIDKNFCACRFVGGINGEQDGAESRRKRRSTHSPLVPLDELTECSHANFDFANTDTDFQKRYRKRFKRDVEDFNKEYNFDKSMSEVDVLNSVHLKLTEPGRVVANEVEERERSRKRRATVDHLIDQDSKLQNGIDYSNVMNSSDWWGFLNSSTSGDYTDIAEIARVSKDETKLLGHPPDEFILQCTFDQTNKCTWQDFEQFQHKKYGNCYTFNHGQRGDDIRFTSRFGSQYGLRLTLFINQDEYVGLFSQEAGVRVAVHKPHSVPFPEDHGFDAKPGTATSFGIRVNEMIRTQLPYGGEDCTHKDRVEGDVYNGHYSFIACEKACIQSTLREQCGCIDDINTLFTDIPICDILNKNQALCQQKIYGMFENNELACNCVQRCNETYYGIQYSTAKWPSEKYEGYLFSAISDHPTVRHVLQNGIEDTLRNVVRLNFMFEELNKQEIKEEPKWAVFDLLAAIGGSMGLYIGVSLITICEVIDYTIDMVMHMCLWGKYKPSGGDV